MANVIKKDNGGQPQGNQPQGMQPQPQPQGAQGTPGAQAQRGDLMRRDPFQPLMRDPFSMFARDPFQLVRELMVDPWRMFNQMSPWGMTRDAGWNVSFDVRETDDAYLFKADMPGIRNEDLEISLVGNQLQITGKRDYEHEQDEGRMYAYERSYGSFSRTFSLPEHADLDNVRSDLKDGVLTLVVPKQPGTTPQRRKIQIGSGSKA